MGVRTHALHDVPHERIHASFLANRVFEEIGTCTEIRSSDAGELGGGVVLVTLASWPGVGLDTILTSTTGTASTACPTSNLPSS